MSRVITPAPTPPQTITVSSTAGFNAGDLVYFNGSTGDYGTPPPSAAGSSVSVPITGPVPLLGGLVGANSSDVGIYGASATKNFAAVLTNGNIVQAFINASTNYPSFRIVDTAGTVVVAETVISTTFTQSGNPNITVAALTGGGFVVVWNNSAGGTPNRPCYAVYTNTGTVTTSAVQDTGAASDFSNSWPVRVVATPSGGFILSGFSTGVAYARGYGATGTAAFAWVTLSAAAASQETGLAVRSNGDFLLVGNVSLTSYRYAIWSSTGTVVVAATTFADVAGTFSVGASDATCLSDGTTFVLAYGVYVSSVYTFAFRFIPTGNVLGSEFYIPTANTYKTAGLYPFVLSIAALSGNKFILINSANLPQNYSISYSIFDSTGACLSGTSGTTSTAAVPIYIPQAFFSFSGNYITALETPSGFISLYYTNRNSNKNYSMQVATVNATTYALVNVTSSNQVVGSASGTPLAYAPSGSNPLGAAFTIAAGGYAAAGVFGTVVKTPEIVNSAAANAVATTTLPNGQVLVAYILLSTGVVNVAVYSVAGVLTQTLSIGTDGLSSGIQEYSRVSISALTSGKFVIAYANSSGSQCFVKLYSSAFTQIGSTVTVSTPGTGGGYIASVSGLTNDRYIIGYSGSSGYPTYAIYDNTNTLLVGPTVITSTAYQYMTVCGYSSGGFLISGVTAGAQQTAQYGNPLGNTFTNTVAFAIVTGGTLPPQNNRAVANTNGVVFLNYSNGTTTTKVYSSNLAVNNGGGGGEPALGGLATNNGTAVGVTGTGVPVLTVQVSGVMQLVNDVDTQVALSASLFQPYVSSPYSQNCMTPSYGPNVGIAYIDVNQKVNYAIVCGSTVPSSVTVLSTSPSNPVPIYPVATSASPAVQKTVFTGVALQTVPAGGAGLVQVSGTAQLGSTYPSTTTYQAFDHQSQGVPGVKGTIVGRAITLQGT
jgi:hypothetical protein